MSHENVLTLHESGWIPHETGLMQHDSLKIGYFSHEIFIKNSNYPKIRPISVCSTKWQLHKRGETYGFYLI